jgi:hypothetical protein
MALWQYKFYILPKKSYDVLKLDIQFFDDNKVFDDEPFWRYQPVDKSYFQEVEKILQTAS